jgi:hypothetical protein
MSKREEEKALEATKKVAEEAKNTKDKHDAARTLQEIEGQVTAQEFARSFDRSLDETKDNVRKSIEEAKNQIPQYTDVVKNYQEYTLQATREMAVDYIEAQKTVMDSLFNSAVWLPYFQNSYRIYSHWFSPNVPVEIYARTVSNIADNLTAITRTTNSMIFDHVIQDLISFGNAFQRAKDNAIELSRINVNSAKAFENTARETAGFSVYREGQGKR